MSTVEIDPWVIALAADAQPNDDAGQAGSHHSLAMWRLREGDQPSLALFSDENRAAAFAKQLNTSDFRLLHPSRHELISLFIQVYKLNVQIAVLDPDQTGARRIFNLRDCLRAARDQLISSSSEFK